MRKIILYENSLLNLKKMEKEINNKTEDDDVKIKLEKALSYNRQMQLQLLVARKKLENLLKNVKDNYMANDELLKDGLVRQRKKGVGIQGAYLKGGTFYLKGNMFFKDIKCRNCPNNPDYIRRKNEDNELFPMDLELKSRHIWSTKDKQGVVLGIKEQIIDYLKHSSRKNVQKNEIDSEKLVKLLSMVPKDFVIDWDHISSYNINHRHSASSCEAIWNVFLNPKLKRSAWSDSENKRLLEASQKYRFQNWQAIAQEVGQRSDFQCFVQFQNYVVYMLPEHRAAKWTKEDDQRLLDIVAKNTIHGVVNWSNVMAHFPHKPRTTLQSRLSHSLNPNINHAPFTPEEDLLLFATVKEYGTKFSCFPRNLFPNRTLVQLRSHYKNTLMNRHNRAPWTLEDDMKLMEFVTKYGAKAWTDCGTYLENKHSRMSCRTRFFTIRKYLERNPDASIDDLPRKHFSTGIITTENWKEQLQQLTDNPKVDLVKPKRKKSVRKNKKGEKPPESEKQPKPEKPPRNRKNQKNYRPSVRSTDYIRTLKSNGIRYYNFFKYAYNFKIDQDPCNQILPDNKILTIVRSSLNPQISLPIQNYNFDATIPDHVRTNIKNTLQETCNYQMPQLLPPNWSSAMGFRALCIHAASNDPDNVTLSDLDDSNDHILLFRQRLRALFYSTALLSRLNPSMVGMSSTTAVEDKPTCTTKKRTTNKKTVATTTSTNKTTTTKKTVAKTTSTNKTTTTKKIVATTTSTNKTTTLAIEDNNFAPTPTSLVAPTCTTEKIEHPLNAKIALLKRIRDIVSERDNSKNDSKKKCTESITNIKTEIES